VIPRETAEGTQGWCRLPSGLVVEEWDFYRQSRG
jgi:putative hemolysin